MKIEIKIFKPSGKYYASDIVEKKGDYYIFQEEFEKIIYDNLPAIYGEGYVVVSNADPEDMNFYEALYLYEDLKERVEKYNNEYGKRI